MEKKERVAIKICIRNNIESVREWIEQMMLFSPENMKLKHYKKGRFVPYDEKVFGNEIKKETINSDYNVFIKDLHNSVTCFTNSNSYEVAILTAILEYDIFINNEEMIYGLITQIMNYIGIVGRIVSLEDNYWQNNIELEPYIRNNKSLSGIPLKKHPIFPDQQAVDVEKLPGYEVQVENIWFGAVWKMWFNDFYYQFVPRENFERFTNCHCNEKISENCRCITLYDDVLTYNEPENREKQWKFKEAIKFKETVNRLREMGTCVDKKDPYIEMFDGNFDHGGKKLFKIYLDNSEGIIAKSKAEKVRVMEYDSMGRVVWQNQGVISEES